MGMARCGEPSPLSVGSFRAVKSRFATALDRSPSGKHSHYPAFISPSLFTNVLVTKAE